MMTVQPTIALGLLSQIGHLQWAPILGGWAVCRARRSRIRQSMKRLQRPGSPGQQVVVRFLLGQLSNEIAAREAAQEAFWEGDMILLNMTESRFRCAEKYLRWFDFALSHYPSALWIAAGDEDTYIQVAHLAEDLGSVLSDGLALYGLVMWLAYFSQSTFDTLDGHTGWTYKDSSAVSRRQAMQRCAASLSMGEGAQPGEPLSSTAKTRHSPCSQLGKADSSAVRARALELGPPSPYPMVSGPLFAVSRGLALLLSRESKYPQQWLSGLMASPRVRNAQVHGPRRSVFACWPAGDAALGLWVAASAASTGQTVRLIQTPFMVQHHPWPSFARGGFTNSSIVMHGLKQKKMVASQVEQAERRSSGPFEPVVRACGSCLAMGFSSWPGSVMNRWTCCSTARGKAQPPDSNLSGIKLVSSAGDSPLWRNFVDGAVEPMAARGSLP